MLNKSEQFNPYSEKETQQEALKNQENTATEQKEQEEQRKFEEVTARTMQKFKELSLREKDVPNVLWENLFDYLHSINLRINPDNRVAVSSALAAFLLEAKQNNDNPYLYDFPINVRILEVGGFDSESLGDWPSLNGSIFLENTDYTGIDIKPIPYYSGVPKTTERGYKMCEKVLELLQMDARDVSSELKGRTYELIFGMGFLGHPMYAASQELGVPQRDYEKEILDSLNTVLRNGGFMFFVNREKQESFTDGMSLDQMRDMGFDLVSGEIYRQQVLILRKVPKKE